jgi:hypothetical protein
VRPSAVEGLADYFEDSSYTGLATSGWTIGSSILNCEPVPTSLVTLIEPPWASARWRAIDRPSPLPPVAQARDASALLLIAEWARLAGDAANYIAELLDSRRQDRTT